MSGAMSVSGTKRPPKRPKRPCASGSAGPPPLELARWRRDLDRFDPRKRVALEILRLLVAVELERAQAARFGHRLDVARRVVPEDADRRHERRQRADDRRDLLRRHEARRVLDEDEPERVRAGVDREHRVVEVGDAADLDSGHLYMGWARRPPHNPPPPVEPRPT